jgi:hypothetical protein
VADGRATKADLSGIAEWKAVCVGEGGYAGLTAYVHAITGSMMSDFGIFGWIEEMP